MKSTSAAVQAEIAKTVLATPITLIELYLDGSTLRLADYPTDVSFDGNTYYSRSIVHSDILTHFSSKLDSCDVEIDDVDKAMTAYMAVEDFKGRLFKMIKIFDGLTASADNIVQFIGFMNQPETDGERMRISIVPVFDRSQSYSPWRRMQSRCNWRFCSTKCGYNSGSEIRGTADSGSTTTLIDATYSGKGAGFAVGGRCRVLAGTNRGQVRYITSYNTSTGEFGFTEAFSSAIDNTSQYKIECDKSKSACEGFSNEASFGGYDAMAMRWTRLTHDPSGHPLVPVPIPLELNGYLPIVYGQARLPGILVAHAWVTDEWDLEGTYMSTHISDRIYAWCEGEIESIEQVFCDGSLIDTTGYKYAEKLGTSSQTLTESEMNDPAFTGDQWMLPDSTYYFRHTALSAFKTMWHKEGTDYSLPAGYTSRYDNVIFWQLGNELSANVKGLKVQAYLANGSPDGSPAWSQNPVWCLIDFLMNRSVKPLESTYIDFSAAKTAADYCDAKGWRCNLVIDKQKKDEDIVKMFLDSFGGFITYPGGKMAINIEKAETYVMSFDDTEGGNDNIIDGELTDWEYDLNDVFNRVIVTYIDEEVRDTVALCNGNLPAAQNYIPYADGNKPFASSGTVYIGGEAVTYTGDTGTQLTGCSARSNDYSSGYPIFQGVQLFPTMTAQYDDEIHQDDCKRVIEKKIDGIAIPTYRQAESLAIRLGRKSVEGNRHIKYKAGPAALLLEPGDVIRMTHSRPGWTNVEFRIVKIAESQDEVLALEGELYDSSFFEENSSNPPGIGTTLPSPYDEPASVTNLTLASTHKINEAGVHIAGIYITYDLPTGDDLVFWHHAEIWMKLSTESDYRFIQVDDRAGQGLTIDEMKGGFTSGDTVSVRVVSVTTTGIKEAFASAPTDSIVVNDGTPTPSDITGLELRGASGGTSWDGKKFLMTWDITAADEYWDHDELEVQTSAVTRITIPGIKAGTWEYNYDATGFTDTLDSYLKTAGGDCTVRVRRRNIYGKYSGWTSLAITQTDPANPQNLTAQGIVGGARFSWDAWTAADFDYYLVRTKISSGGTWSSWQTNGRATSKAREMTVSEASTYGGTASIYVEVKAVDIWGNESTVSSTNVASAQATGDFVLDEALGLTKLLSASPENLVENPGFEKDTEGWIAAAGFSVQTSVVNSGNKALQGACNSTYRQMNVSKLYEVKPGEKFYLEGYWRSSSDADGTCRPIFAIYYDKDKVYAGTTGSPVYGTAPQTSFVKANGVITIPSGVYYMRLGVSIQSGATTGSYYFDDLYAKRMVLNEFVDTIIADKIAAGTITSKIITLAITGGAGDVAIKCGKTDFGSTAAGFILGIDDSDSDKAKFEIGDSSNYLKWDGSSLTIRGVLNADDVVAGVLKGRGFITGGSYITQATSSGAGTVYVDDTTDFPSSGQGMIGGSDVFSYTGKTSTTLTGCTGVGNNVSGSLIAPYSGSIDILTLDADRHSFSLYSNRGDGTRLKTVAIGAENSNAFIEAGNTTSGWTQRGILGQSYSNYGVRGASSTYHGVEGQSDTSYGVYGVGLSAGSYGGAFSGYAAPIALAAAASASAPTHSAVKGALWVTSAGVLYINTDGSTTWQKVGAQ